jgi:ABC-2 type transport system permease protein
MGTQLKALILKELRVVLRDPKGRLVIILPPIIQLLVFSLAATLEVKNADVAVLNHDGGRMGHELIERIEGAPSFRRVTQVHNPRALRALVDRERAHAGIEIGPTFSRDISAGQAPDLHFIFDGRRSNSSQIVASYLNEIVVRFAADEARPRGREPARPEVVARNWFNPNLTYTWFTVPGLIAIIALIVGLLVTALSVARERELGTFDQLMVSPLTTGQILLGKLLPPMLIGFVHITFYVIVALLVFEVPLRGSLSLLYGTAVLYLAAVVGVGLFISSLCSTQQQAILGAFLFASPATLLSGFATPIENMPRWLQLVTLANPPRHFIVVTRGVFLKGLPVTEVVKSALPLLLIAVVTLSAAAWLFRKRTE